MSRLAIKARNRPRYQGDTVLGREVPDETVDNDCTLVGGATAHAILAKPQNSPVAPDTSTKITTSTIDQTFYVKFPDAAVLVTAGYQLKTVTIWAYVKSGQCTFSLKVKSGLTDVGSLLVATNQDYQWVSVTGTITGFDLDNIGMRFKHQSGVGQAEIAACYVMVETEVITVSGIDSAAEINAAIAAAVPGSVINIADGTYDGFAISIPNTVNGTALNRILIKPQNPGGVTFTGQTAFAVAGSYTTVSGFNFTDCGVGNVANGVIVWTCAQATSHHNRFTGNHLLRVGPPLPAGPYPVDDDVSQFGHEVAIRIELAASSNEIDNNIFEDMHCVSMQVRLPVGVLEADLPMDTYIHHNSFLTAGFWNGSTYIAYTTNGGEAIQIGQNSYIQAGSLVTRTRVEDNTFQDYHWDLEMISIKSSGCFVLRNKATDCTGGFNQRLGDNNIFDSNVLRRCSRGIGIHGTGHKITNNWFNGASDWPAGGNNNREPSLILYTGNIRSAGGNSDPTINCEIAHNTVINERWPLRFIEGGVTSPDLLDMPTGNLIYNNILGGQTSGDAVTGGKEGTTPLANTTIEALIAANSFRANLCKGSVATVNVGQSGGNLNVSGEAVYDLADAYIPKLAAGTNPPVNAAIASSVTLDIVGTVRASFAPPDIGAYERTT